MRDDDAVRSPFDMRAVGLRMVACLWFELLPAIAVYPMLLLPAARSLFYLCVCVHRPCLVWQRAGLYLTGSRWRYCYRPNATYVCVCCRRLFRHVWDGYGSYVCVCSVLLRCRFPAFYLLLTFTPRVRLSLFIVRGPLRLRSYAHIFTTRVGLGSLHVRVYFPRVCGFTIWFAVVPTFVPGCLRFTFTPAYAFHRILRFINGFCVYAGSLRVFCGLRLLPALPFWTCHNTRLRYIFHIASTRLLPSVAVNIRFVRLPPFCVGYRQVYRYTLAVTFPFAFSFVPLPRWYVSILYVHVRVLVAVTCVRYLRFAVLPRGAFRWVYWLV